ncbi:MAG: VWA domain-containing protein, partial [Chloroflexota bacterium]
VTITLLVDASASMASGTPHKLLFAKRAAAALGYIGLASEDRVAISALGGRASRRHTALRGSGRVFRLLSTLSTIEAAPGPTDLVAAARHAAAQLSGRGVIVLISDLLDPAADRVIRELAATRSELIVLHVLSPEELDPTLEGDLRLVDAETGDGIDVTADLPTLDAYRERLTAWKAGFAQLAAKRRATYVDLASDTHLNDLIFAELRRRRVLG